MAKTDTDDYTFTLMVDDWTDSAADTTVEAMTLSTDGTGCYYDEEAAPFTTSIIPHDDQLYGDFSANVDVGYVFINICGWYDADVD